MTDSEGATSDSVTINVTLRGTPWYPIYPIAIPAGKDVTAIDGVLVKITKDGSAVGEAVVELDADNAFVLKPADYYNAGIPGMKSDSAYQVEVYDWIFGDELGEKWDDELEDIQVPQYDKPAMPVVTHNVNGGKLTIDVTAPLAQGFALTIFKDGKECKAAEYAYMPNEDGMFITTNVTFEYQLFAGSYTYTVRAVNPEG